ncbi:MAG: hypothetical protein CL943_01580 [Candidatus Diapherotrites archaeon]|uniref:50S ribosomal protein L15 n=1 Tax=Candidatus Iainarchaeum sp. TaxID=3101447 RepID=A0A2D6M0M4_9ARCH|nr:hypothetical protein [Candidatus Diapherotrites archaeon]|tara:strand:+ start:7668 stop:8129 length:462 start_codon:yes stop_codon:yes gene_type:complete
MTVRRRKKKNTLRGHRTHGQGDTKNRRGAGSRGGRGRAGSHKHKFNKYSGEFGTQKKKIIGKPRGASLNLDQIEQFLPGWIAAKKIEQKGTEIIVDGKKVGFSKIVSRGTLVSKIIFENVSASKKALEKLKASGSVLKEVKEEKTEDVEEKTK